MLRVCYDSHCDDARQGSDEDASPGERRRREARRGADGEGGAHLPRGGVEGVEHTPWIEAIDRLSSDHRGTGDCLRSMPAGDEPPSGGERELTQPIAARNEQGRTPHGGSTVGPAQRERLDLPSYAAKVACPQQVALGR